MSGPLYKFYFVNYTFVAKSVRKELLTKNSWVRFSVDIVFLLSNFTIFRPGERGGVGTDGRTSFLTPPVNQKFSPTPKICLKLCSSSKIVDFTSFYRSLKLSNIRPC